MTSNGRQPQNTEIKISLQPLKRSNSNLKLKLMSQNQTLQIFEMKTTSNRRQPQNIKIEIYQQPRPI